MTLLTVIAIYMKQISVFYILYLFWWDELLKTVFDWFRYKSIKDQLETPKEFLVNVKSRLFFLIIYLVFIIVFFGFMLNWRDEHLISLNFEVFLFRNLLFNMSILSFLLREIYVFRKFDAVKNSYNVLSKGIITLHVSLIFGVLIWFLVTEKIVELKEYATILAILPFLLLKIVFEVKEIKNPEFSN